MAPLKPLVAAIRSRLPVLSGSIRRRNSVPDFAFRRRGEVVEESHSPESEDPDARTKRTPKSAMDLILEVAPSVLDLASVLAQQGQDGAPISVMLLGALASAVRVVIAARR